MEGRRGRGPDRRRRRLESVPELRRSRRRELGPVHRRRRRAAALAVEQSQIQSTDQNIAIVVGRHRHLRRAAIASATTNASEKVRPTNSLSRLFFSRSKSSRRIGSRSEVCLRNRCDNTTDAGTRSRTRNSATSSRTRKLLGQRTLEKPVLIVA